MPQRGGTEITAVRNFCEINHPYMGIGFDPLLAENLMSQVKGWVPFFVDPAQFAVPRPAVSFIYHSQLRTRDLGTAVVRFRD